MKKLLLIVCVTLILFSLFTLAFVSHEHTSVFSFTKRALGECVILPLNNEDSSKPDEGDLDANVLDSNASTLDFEMASTSLKFSKSLQNVVDLNQSSLQKETFRNTNQRNFATTASACVVMERDSGRILFQKDGTKRLPMASTTKIVTALTVLNNSSLDDVVTISNEACGIEGSSIYLRAGEKLSVKELLYGLMLRSGNDCAVALALHVGGSVQNFAQMMNQTAKNLGCTDSNFANPHGLHDENHYTTAKDLATITCNAIKNKDFADIVATKSVKIANDGYDYPRVLVNKNKLLNNFADADGVKTGYTKKAGRCFVGSATRNGMQVVAVVLNCVPMFEETAQMLDVSFANYQNVCIVPQNKLCGVVYKKNRPIYYYCNETFSFPITVNEKLTRQINIDEQTQTMDILLDGVVIKTLKLEPAEY